MSTSFGSNKVNADNSLLSGGTAHWSYGPLVLRPIGPTAHWLSGNLFFKFSIMFSRKGLCTYRFKIKYKICIILLIKQQQLHRLSFPFVRSNYLCSVIDHFLIINNLHAIYKPWCVVYIVFLSIQLNFNI